MNARGQYGNSTARATYARAYYDHVEDKVHVGAFLVHTLELKQRYNNVHTGAAQALLTDLTKEGHATLAGTNRWEIALKEGAWVLFTWHPDSSALEVTVTDRELRPVDQLASTRRRYETILNRITPRLKSFGATTVGAAIVDQIPRPISGTHVGLKLIHTPGDSERAVRQIDNEMQAIVDAAYTAMGIDRASLHWGSPGYTASDLEALKDWSALSAEKKAEMAARVDAAKAKAQQSPYWGFFQTVITPVFADWTTFRSQDRFYDLFTSWEEYEKWLERVRQLRATVEAKGIKIATPVPVELTQTLPEAAAKGFEEILKFGKYALIGVLGIGAVVALSSVASNLRSGKDPGEKYMELIRERRPRAPRARAPRALPPPPPRRAPLALPPGEDV